MTETEKLRLCSVALAELLLRSARTGPTYDIRVAVEWARTVVDAPASNSVSTRLAVLEAVKAMKRKDAELGPNARADAPDAGREYCDWLPWV